MFFDPPIVVLGVGEAPSVPNRGTYGAEAEKHHGPGRRLGNGVSTTTFDDVVESRSAADAESRRVDGLTPQVEIAQGEHPGTGQGDEAEAAAR